MYILKFLRRLLRPQRRRVLALFNVLAPNPIVLEGWAARSAFLQQAADWLNGVFGGPTGVRMRALFGVAALVIVTASLRALFSYLREYLGQYIGGRVLIDLRLQLFERLQRLSLAFYESQRVGDLMSRLTADVGLVQQLVTADMANYVTAPVIVFVGIAVMFVLNWKLTLFLVVLAPLTAYVVARTGRRIGHLTRSQQERIADLNARLHERLASIRIIQSFTRESYEIGQFRRLNENAFDAMIRVARLGAFAPQAIQCMSTVSVAIVATYAGVLIIKGELALAGLMFYFALTQRVGYYFVKFGALHLRVNQSLAALGRVSEVLSRAPDVQERPEAISLPPAAGHIALRDVTFSYPEGEAVLDGVKLEITPGEAVALVGSSGARKTSLANLIMRFYDASEGSVEIDGCDVRDVTLHSLRAQIGLVPQETILFGGTIEDNIRYGRAGATAEEVVTAAKAANAHEFIGELPQGYGTEVGERGLKLSGGQRQRIAIARALLKDPRILILDEATSSLDAASEALVQEALERLMKGRTTLVIAHRLSTIQNADRIVVLSDGQIAEEGRHAELLARGGTYARLYRSTGDDSYRHAAAEEIEDT
jgi:subfamily B ATP-binding cassette protein MsbA